MFVYQSVVLLLMTTMMMMMAVVDAHKPELRPQQENYHPRDKLNLAKAKTTSYPQHQQIQHLSSSSSSSLSSSLSQISQLLPPYQPELQPLVHSFSSLHQQQQQVGFSPYWTDGGGTQVRVS